MPRLSIITATILRRTLKQLCNTVDSQTDHDWEHLIQVDKPRNQLTGNEKKLLASIEHPQRTVDFCDRRHNNVGNSCRGVAYRRASGEYIHNIDDDDYYADPQVFETLRQVTAVWCIFPKLNFERRDQIPEGEIYHFDPPRAGATGTPMFCYRRDTGLTFPDSDDYFADGVLVEELKQKYPYQTLPGRPLVIYPKPQHGRTQQEIDRLDHRQQYARDGC
jgi:glycosyltransferase involved in cell wall biosynthesis